MMQVPCECPLAGPVNNACPHHGKSKKPERPPKHKTMFTSELDRADWVRVAIASSEFGFSASGVIDFADAILEAIQARELR